MNIRPQEAAAINSAIDSVYRDSCKAWFLRFGYLRNIEGVVTQFPNLKLRLVQERMFSHHDRCLRDRKPCKQIVLKPRKDGASTAAQALMYHRLRRFGGRSGAAMGDVAGTSDTVFEIFRTFAEHDRFVWGDGVGNLVIGDKENNLTDDITLPNRSTYKKVTAGSNNANRGGTIQMANSTETAYYPNNLDRDPLTGFLGSWYEHGESSFAVMDSTSNGPFGKFYEMFSDERNGWEKIFVAWHEEIDHRLKFAALADEKKFRAELDTREHSLIDRFGVDLEQLHWLRDKLRSKCGNSIEQLNKEYPPSIEEAFLQKSALRFNIQVIESMERLAAQHQPQVGTLSGEEEASFVHDDLGDIHIFEEPKYGCRYLGIFDPCTGRDQQSKMVKADPDLHSIGILRDEYLDATNGQWYPPMIAAHHNSRVEVEVACQNAAAMSRLYGLCTFVVETNGCGLFPVKELRRLGIPLWQRKQPTDSGNTEQADGWFMTEQLRKTVIDNLAAKINDWKIEEPTFDVWDARILSELKKLVNHNGKPQAMAGFHDDTVIMTALGLYLRAAAVEMKMRQRKKVDYRSVLRRERWGSIR